MRRTIGSLALVGLLLAGCGDDDGSDAGGEPGTTTSSSPTERPTSTTGAGESTTTTAPDVEVAPCPDPFAGNSPAVFDEDAGTYAVDLIAATAGGSVEFDVVQWLVGEDADAAYEAETGDSSGVPNDYFVVNESDEVRTAPLDPGADIRLLDPEGGDATATAPATLADLAAHDPLKPFWLTFDGGTVVGVCEQYVP